MNLVMSARFIIGVAIMLYAGYQFLRSVGVAGLDVMTWMTAKRRERIVNHLTHPAYTGCAVLFLLVVFSIVAAVGAFVAFWHNAAV